MLAAGCAPIQLPRIDPTGSQIFAPGTTELTLPRLHGDRSGAGGIFPEPAFPTPAVPPPCIQGMPLPGTATIAPPAVPAVQPISTDLCGDDCLLGPKAVLQNGHCCALNSLHLPDRGTRGKIQLTPQRVIAPVGGEVLMLAGVCGPDGTLMPGETIEWMVAPDGVGSIVQVGDDERWLVHSLARTRDPEKLDVDYAIGRTSSRAALITRGTRTPRDDVSLRKGETWMTLTSASEGVSRVTVLAPESDCWDHRKATTTIYWIDAAWQFPKNQMVRAGSSTSMTTRVTRSERTIPAEGWIVRYEVLTPTLATLGPQHLSVMEVPVGPDGNATVGVNPVAGTSGTATVEIQVIRPAEADLPRMVLARANRTITWAAPLLEVRAAGPESATIDQPIALIANVRNPGSLPAENVRLTMNLPVGVQFDSSSPIEPSAQGGNQIVWDIGTLPPQTQLDIEVRVIARETFRATFTARAADGLVDESDVLVNVFRPSLAVQVRPAGGERAEVGQTVEFEIDVTNTGDRPLQNVALLASGSSSITHYESGQISATLERPETLAPGEQWNVLVSFVLNDAGQQCIQVTATAAGGQTAADTACVVGVNPPVPTPSLLSDISLTSARLDGQGENAPLEPTPDQPIREGQWVIADYTLINDGRLDLTGLRVTATFDRRLDLRRATENADVGALGRFQVSWYVPSLPAGDRRVLQAAFVAVGPPGETTMILTVESDQGATADDQVNGTILPAQPQPAAPQAPPLAPSTRQPAPTVPPGAIGGDVTPQPTPPASQPAQPPATAEPQRRDLQVRITDRRDPAQVGDEMPYTITIENAGDVVDENVRLRVSGPPDVRLRRLRPLFDSTGLQHREVMDGVFEVSPIAALRPGESVRFEIVLQTNRPQEKMEIRATATSELFPQGVSAVEDTTVNALPNP